MKNNKLIFVISMFALIVGIVSYSAIGNVYLSGTLWSLNCDTVVLTDKTNNVNIGQNASTSYKLKVNGTSNFINTLYMNDTIVMRNKALSWGTGVTVPPYTCLNGYSLKDTMGSQYYRDFFFSSGDKSVNISSGYPVGVPVIKLYSNGSIWNNKDTIINGNLTVNGNTYFTKYNILYEFDKLGEIDTLFGAYVLATGFTKSVSSEPSGYGFLIYSNVLLNGSSARVILVKNCKFLSNNEITFRVKFSSVTNTHIQFGLGVSSTTNITDGMFFKYDTRYSNYLKTITGDSNSYEVNTSTIIPDTSFHLYKIKFDNTSGNVKYYYDNVLIYTCSTSGNIETNAVGFYWFLQSRAILTSGGLYIDFIRINGDRI